MVELRGADARLVDQADGAARDLVDHEARLRALETARWQVPAVSVLIALAGLGGACSARLDDRRNGSLG